MTVEEAIATAIRYETGIENMYRRAATETPDPAGRHVFETLAQDERRHVRYLEDRAAELASTGSVTAEAPASVVPAVRTVAAGLARLRERAAAVRPEPHHGADLSMLRRALEMELETSGFYKTLVRSLPPEGRRLFERFVEIEEGHVAVVQAEIDAIAETGFWFDIREFDLEAG